MIIENDYIEDIQKIWKENNSGYITYESNQIAINDNSMLKIVYRENNVTMAYAAIYFGKDFCEKEEFPNKIENMPDKVAYIWEIVTDKKYTGKGIATKLLEYIIEKYKDYSIFSCIDLSNISSLKLHEKSGFVPLYKFEEKENNRVSKHVMMIRNTKKVFLYKYENDIDKNQLVKLFESVGWKTAEYPNRLYNAIKNSEYVMTVWDGENLIGLISAITDGYINVFITYLLVNPEYQKVGLGKIMMNDFMKKFEGFGRRILTTELDKEQYYKKFGFNIDGIAMFNKDWKEDIQG